MIKNNFTLNVIKILMIIYGTVYGQDYGWVKIGGPIGGEVNYIEVINNNEIFGVIGGNQLFQYDRNDESWSKIFRHKNYNIRSVRYMNEKYYFIGNQVCQYELYSSANMTDWQLVDKKDFPAHDIFKFNDYYLIATWGNGIIILDNEMNIVDNNNSGLKSHLTGKITKNNSKLYVIGNGWNGVNGQTGCGLHDSDDGGYTWNSIDFFNNEFVRDIEVDSFGRIFVGTDIGLVYSSDNGSTWDVLFGATSGYPILDVVIDEDGNVCFTRSGHGVYKIDKDLITTSIKRIRDRGQRVEYSDGNYIIGDESRGFFKYNLNTSELIDFNEGVGTRTRINNVAVDELDRIYINVLYDGIYFSDDNGGTWNNITAPDFRNIREAILTKDNNLLAATDGKVFLINRENLSIKTVSVDFGAYDKRMVVNRNTGEIFGGNSNIYTSQDNGNLWRRIRSYQNEYGRINSLAVSETNEIIVAYENLVSRRNSTGQWENITSKLPNTFIFPNQYNDVYYAHDKFYISNRVELFYSTDNGESWQNNTLEHNFNVQYYFDIIEGKDADIFVTSHLPHYLFYSNNKGRSWSSFEGDAILNEVGVIQCLAQRKDGAVFAGTQGDGLVGFFGNVSEVYEEKVIKDFFLLQNYPNPFNPTTTISYDLPKQSSVKIKVFNSIGKEIRTLVDKRQNAGRYTIDFDGSNLASGVYYYSLTADNYREVRKMVLLK